MDVEDNFEEFIFFKNGWFENSRDVAVSEITLADMEKDLSFEANSKKYVISQSRTKNWDFADFYNLSNFFSPEVHCLKV